MLFLEHKRLYREPYNRSPHPGPDFIIPFGKRQSRQNRRVLTIVTYGALVQKALQAAMQVERDATPTSASKSSTCAAWRPTIGRPSARPSKKPAA